MVIASRSQLVLSIPARARMNNNSTAWLEIGEIYQHLGEPQSSNRKRLRHLEQLKREGMRQGKLLPIHCDESSRHISMPSVGSHDCCCHEMLFPLLIEFSVFPSLPSPWKSSLKSKRITSHGVPWAESRRERHTINDLMTSRRSNWIRSEVKRQRVKCRRHQEWTKLFPWILFAYFNRHTHLSVVCVSF